MQTHADFFGGVVHLNCVVYIIVQKRYLKLFILHNRYVVKENITRTIINSYIGLDIILLFICSLYSITRFYCSLAIIWLNK